MLVFTAPHTRKTFRFIKKRFYLPKIHKQEVGLFQTLSLNKIPNYNVIYNTSYFVDPNFHSWSRFRSNCYIGQSHNIDLHEMKNSHNVEIIIGTGRIVDNLEEIIRYLNDNYLTFKINEKFAAKKNNTVTRFMEEKYKIKAIQLELSSHFLYLNKRKIEHLAKIAELFEKT